MTESVNQKDNDVRISVDLHGGVQSPPMSDQLVRLQNLRELMKANGWKQADLARALDARPSQVSNWFNGEKPIGEKLARTIEEKLGRPRYWLDDRPAVEAAPILPDPRQVAGSLNEPLRAYDAGISANGGTPLRGMTAHLVTGTKAARTIPIVHWELINKMLDGSIEAATVAKRLETFSQASENAFFVAVPDDAMAPHYAAGDHVLLDPQAVVRPGDVVLVQTPNGDLFLRQYKVRTPGSFTAVPFNDAYLTLSSTDDALVVVAKVTEHRRYFA